MCKVMSCNFAPLNNPPTLLVLCERKRVYVHEGTDSTRLVSANKHTSTRARALSISYARTCTHHERDVKREQKVAEDDHVDEQVKDEWGLFP